MTRICCLIFFIILLTGCGTVIPLSDANRQAIHKIAVVQKVDMPKKMVFMRDGTQFGAFFGAIGEVIRGAAAESKKCVCRNFTMHFDQF